MESDPDSSPSNYYEGRDLALTTDFRSVFSEVAARGLGATRMESVFPGFAGGTESWLGML